MAEYYSNRIPDEYTNLLINIIEDDNTTAYNFIDVFDPDLLDIPTIIILFYKCINRNKYIGKLFREKIQYINNFGEIMNKMEIYIQSNIQTRLKLFEEELEIWNDANPNLIYGE